MCLLLATVKVFVPICKASVLSLDTEVYQYKFQINLRMTYVNRLASDLPYLQNSHWTQLLSVNQQVYSHGVLSLKGNIVDTCSMNANAKECFAIRVMVYPSLNYCLADHEPYYAYPIAFITFIWHSSALLCLQMPFCCRSRGRSCAWALLLPNWWCSEVDKVQDEQRVLILVHVSAFQSQWQPSTFGTSGHVCGQVLQVLKVKSWC